MCTLYYTRIVLYVRMCVFVCVVSAGAADSAATGRQGKCQEGVGSVSGPFARGEILALHIIIIMYTL